MLSIELDGYYHNGRVRRVKGRRYNSKCQHDFLVRWGARHVLACRECRRDRDHKRAERKKAA